MRILVLGAGRVGSLVALELSKHYEVAVADKSEKKLESLKQTVSVFQLDLNSSEILLETVREFEVVVDALPGYLGYKVVAACAKLGRDLVDVSFMPEDPMLLQDLAGKSGATIVVDAGFAPGLSNILVGSIQEELGDLEKVEISVGGIPKEPRPPLYHAILFSPIDLIDEYIRPARIVLEGVIKSVDPLSKIEKVKILGFELERFPTDGLRTMLHTVKAKNMTEYTLRWPGHLERMKFLKELGFFDKKHLDKTLEVVAPHMTYEVTDISIMEVIGGSEGRRARYFLYDEAKEGHTSMARVTGYVAVHVAELVIKGKISEGLIPPELLGMDSKAFDYIVSGVRSKGIRLERLE